MKKLIAYYSRPGENYFDGKYTWLPTGITEFAAKQLRELTGADLFKIEQVSPYSKDYQTARQQAQHDKDTNARPAIKALPENFDAYDEIYLGYPNFCGTMPMAVYTFLEALDWNGKTIHPFCTNEGDGLSRTKQEIAEICQGAKVDSAAAITGSDIRSSKEHLEEWLRRKE